MTNEELGWAMVIGAYWLITVVLPAAGIGALAYGAYWLGKRKPKRRKRNAVCASPAPGEEAPPSQFHSTGGGAETATIMPPGSIPGRSPTT